MLTEIFGYPIELVEGEIIDKGSDTTSYATTTTTIYRDPNSYVDRRETSTSYSTYTNIIFHIRNEVTKATKSVSFSAPKLNPIIGNHIRVFSAGAYNFALADDTTKTLFIRTHMYYEELNESRYWMVWCSVPIILLSGLTGGIMGGILGMSSIAFLMIFRRYTVRWTLWQTRLEFKKDFEGYKIRYKWR